MVTCGPGEGGTRQLTIHFPGRRDGEQQRQVDPSSRPRASRNHGPWICVGWGLLSSRRLSVASASGENVNRVLPSTSVLST